MACGVSPEVILPGSRRRRFQPRKARPQDRSAERKPAGQKNAKAVLTWVVARTYISAIDDGVAARECGDDAVSAFFI
jgi:hypothetical protein